MSRCCDEIDRVRPSVSPSVPSLGRSLPHAVSVHVRLIIRARLVNREICRSRRCSPPQLQQQQRRRRRRRRRCLKRQTSIYRRPRVDARRLARSQVLHYPRRLFITGAACTKFRYNRTTSRPPCVAGKRLVPTVRRCGKSIH